MDDQQPTSGPVRRERRDARENRQQLLLVAKQLFAEQGVDATSMYEVARTVGVGQGTLYRHFADKGALCQALIQEDLEQFQARVGALISDTAAVASPLARLDMLIVEKNQLTESHLPLFAAMDEAGTAKREKRSRGPFHAWLHQQIVALLNEAIAQGEVDELDVDFTADALLAAVKPHLYRHQREELHYSSARINAAMRRLFIDGLRR